MTNARLLDVTRLASRAGLVATGVDRVELAYLQAFTQNADVPVFGLCRTALGFVILDRAGLIALGEAYKSRKFSKPDLLSRLNRRLSDAARRGQSFVRRHAVARARRAKLKRLLKHVPVPFTYFNVGHSNLVRTVCRAIKSRQGAEIAVLIHDTIPLDWPALQRPATVADFRSKLIVAGKFADRIICSSAACALDVRRHLAALGSVPPVIVAHLGVEPSTPVPEDIPLGVMPLRPYFVVLGTIEPRKNHALLLDIWDDWGPGAPELLICGRRGWLNKEVFDRLDAGVPHVREVPDLSDGAIAALLLGAQGLLFPSLSEGFGLPPIEAAALGVPVLCADLPPCRELLGDWAVYVDAQDRYSWTKEISRFLQTAPQDRAGRLSPPTWSAHFRKVLGEA
ncbi:glycosyltransferase [Loktanella salsilacus]|uniref:glycosyltransferase n=1 Tax=Loktanella salsilacus TaxID=195913 RepID=UPI0037369FFF